MKNDTKYASIVGKVLAGPVNLSVLTSIFVVLKLTGTGIVGSWPWLLVLSPYLFQLILLIVLGLLYLVIAEESRK